jgi:hypothetical protein
MKKHKHIIGTFIILIIMNLQAISQITVDVSGGIRPLLQNYDTGVGFSANLCYRNFGLELGYSKFSAKGMDLSLSAIPIYLISKDYTELNKFKFYYGAKFGACILSTDGDVMGISLSSSDTYFGGGLQIGSEIEVTPKIAAFLNLEWNYIFSSGNSSSWSGLNIGLTYTISEMQ